MKLTEALKKSNVGVIRRGSDPGVVFVKRGTDLYVQGDPTGMAQELNLEMIEANDWVAQISSWIGTREPKAKEKAEKK